MEESRKNELTRPLLVEPTQRSQSDANLPENQQNELRRDFNLEELRQNQNSLGVHTTFRKYSESYLDEMLEDMEHASVEHRYQKNQKLSKSRGINLPIIKLDEATRPRSIALGELKREYTTPVANSPVAYTLKHDVLLDSDAGRLRHSNSFHKSGENNVVDIRIYFSNGEAVQFAVEDGMTACADDLLFLISEHNGIEEDVANATLALWLISPLFEIQLKPHHRAFEVFNKWPLFLRRFTMATEEEIEFDEPLLVIRRNVRLSIPEEKMYQDAYSNLVEILYYDAKEEFMSGRYIIDTKKCIEISALQLLVEYGPLDKGEDPYESVHDKLAQIVPAYLLNRVKSFHLFGLIECKSGLEKQIIKEYKDVSKKYSDRPERQKAYLDLLREVPSYGATFFTATTDRGESSSLFEKSKRLIGGGQQQLELLIGVSCEYLTVANKQKNELLLTRRISDCSWFRSSEIKDDEDEEIPSFFVHFPEDSALLQLGNDNSSPNEQTAQSPVLVSRLLHIFSKQSSLMENLMNQFYEQSASVLGSTEELGSPASDGQTPQSEINSPLSNSLSNAASNKSTASRSSDKKSIRSDIPSPSSSLQYSSKLSKLCTAKLDENGKCVEAHGTLKRILLECN